MRSLCSLLACLSVVSISAAEPISLLSRSLHLGVKGKPEWAIFSGKTPASESLQLEFQAAPNTTEHSLVIRQSDVKQDWNVDLNDRRLGQLHLLESDLVHVLSVPPGTLTAGKNQLKISARTPEDIVLHEIQLVPQARADYLSESKLQVTVREGGTPIPARITVVDEQGFLLALHAPSHARLGVRPGVIYTGDGRAEVGLRPGDYKIYATRGPEYGLAEQRISVKSGETATVDLELNRVVPTPGWIAADTHIHTLTLSRHGDATLQERMLTLAAEGVEFAVCTEHNLHADYTQAAQALGLAKYFTAVAGNEVTTRKGHFNIFPVDTLSPPPDAKLENWAELMKAIRATPKVQVVVLNHPQDVHSGFTPMAPENLHPVTGRNLRGSDFSFDAMELINSGAMRSDWMEPVRTWFGLLNRGYRITGVGASDSHDVSRFIVGQGRTYIQADDNAPGQIDVSRACTNLLAGRAVVSLGLFPEIRIGQHGPGGLVRAERSLQVQASVLGPPWMTATQAVLYANGIAIHHRTFATTDEVTKGRFEFNLPDRKQDYHLIMVASGPGVTEPYWSVARPYQPSSLDWDPVVLGITNPIWVDADGDGKFTAPRIYAEQLVKNHADPKALVKALAGYDQPVSSHAAEMLEMQGQDLTAPQIREAFAAAAPQVRKGFELYLSAGRR